MGGPARHRRPAHRPRRLPVPGHPRWVGHYEVRVRMVDGEQVRIPVMRVGRGRLVLWRLGCRIRSAALAFWRSLYIREND